MCVFGVTVNLLMFVVGGGGGMHSTFYTPKSYNACLYINLSSPEMMARMIRIRILTGSAPAQYRRWRQFLGASNPWLLSCAPAPVTFRVRIRNSLPQRELEKWAGPLPFPFLYRRYLPRRRRKRECGRDPWLHRPF